MTALSSMETSGSSASRVLGRKMDSIPFSSYQVLLIFVLGFTGFVEAFDLVMTGSLLVLAKTPLHLTGTDTRWLILGPSMMLVVSGFAFSAVGDRLSRKAMLLIGVISTTFLTLLIPLVQNAEQLIILRTLTGLGAGGVVSAAFPIATELLPAQHRRTYGAVYEMSLASAFTVVPAIGGLLAGNADAFRWLALPGGLALLFMPAIIYFLLPESPRWHLRRGHAQIAVDIVNRIIARSGNRVPPLTVAALGNLHEDANEKLPPYRALFARGQLRWTVVGVVTGGCASTAFFLIATLLPKALTNQGYAISASLGLTSIIYAASFFGKGFTGFLMEIIGRRWTILYAMAGSFPGIFLMLLAHRAGPYAGVVMTMGGLIIGFTVLSTFTASRVYLSEQFPTALRGRGHIFGESVGRIVGHGLVPFFIAPLTGSPMIFFGTIALFVAVGAFLPILFGKETIGQIEVIAAEEVPVPA
ncbi:MAG: MFS transporter [Alphaproteobacteria bacterium]|nr:MFS transporter [Alphaproteobacteria bacterium]